MRHFPLWNNKKLSIFPRNLVVAGFFALFSFSPLLVLAGDVGSAAIELVNKEREENGLSLVRPNELLMQAAAAKAEDMVKNDYFAHTSPAGETPWYWLKQVGYNYRAAGENLAINYTDAKEQHKAWMKSPTHRANILNSRFEEIGMATRHGRIHGKNASITVQLFGASRSVAALPKASEPVKQTAPQAIQGAEVETEAVLPKELSSPLLTPRASRPTVTVLVNETLFEQFMSSSLVTDYPWLAWSRLLSSLLFAMIVVLTPILFVGEMALLLRSLFRERHPV